jgi:hypothetical protein
MWGRARDSSETDTRGLTPPFLWSILSSVETKHMITPIDKTHWEDLYARLHDAYVECITHNNPTYEQKLAQVLDHMIENKKHLYIR